MVHEIETVAMIGLGAVGINFAAYLQAHLPEGKLRIIADAARIERYVKDGVFYNDQRCSFSYYTDTQLMPPADLVIIATKAMGLADAMERLSHQIDEHTLIMSAINGISSEEILAQRYLKENIIYTVAQGMDATKQDNHVTCQNMGELCFGDAHEGAQQEKVERIHRFFTRIGFPHHVKEDILHHQWGKFMLNVGLNQVVAYHHGTYATIQRDGEARSQMLAAMREVQQLSVLEGIHLTEDEVMAWASLCDSLSPEGMPSMAQDVMNQRKTEVALFAEEVCRRSKQVSFPCPVNEWLRQELHKIEASYHK